MLTPASGIVRTTVEQQCHECRAELRNITRYPRPEGTPVQWRCANRDCGQCYLPPLQLRKPLQGDDVNVLHAFSFARASLSTPHNSLAKQ